MSDFGEPWTCTSSKAHTDIMDREHRLVLTETMAPPTLRRRLEHATACVNSLAGISRPAEFVERAKAMERRIERALVGDDPDMPDFIQPLGWLESMIEACEQPEASALSADDPASWLMMIGEVRELHKRLRAILRGDADE